MSITTRAPRAAYIHVPFCAHRCGYCDFTLIAGRDDLIGDYLRQLDREIEVAVGASQLEDPIEVDTLFFGGGTPTHPSSPQLRQLLQIVQSRFQLTGGGEFSVEANPLD